MKKLSFLLIGDLHYPEKVKEIKADIGDRRVGVDFTTKISSIPLLDVIQKLTKVIDDNNIGSILLVGDLTSYGDEIGYEKCVKYLVEQFNLNENSNIDTNSIHVVPGNHDLKLPKYNSPSENDFEKFSYFKKAWEENYGDILTLDIRKTEYSEGSHRINIISLNSSFGCGEFRDFPDKYLNDYHQFIYSLKDKYEDDNFERIVYDQMDSPALLNDCFTHLYDYLENSDSKELNILLAHHNLLPQFLTRIRLYPEMLNAGRLRKLLYKQNKPIIFCHGHIHDKPIEILRNPRNPNAIIVLVSAPELKDGFCLININYSKKNFPIGLTIEQFIYDEDSIVKPCSKVKGENNIYIKFYDEQPDYEILSEKLPKVIRLFDHNRQYTLGEIKKKYEGTYSNTTNNFLADMILEGFWIGALRIDNMELLPQNWRIRRVK